MYASKFQVRCSSIDSIMASMSLTHKQYWRMVYLIRRRSGKTVSVKTGKKETGLSKNMVEELRDLLANHNRPSLPAGLKTYCEDWLTSKIYNRYKDFTSRVTEQGNRGEEQAIELTGKYESDPFMFKHEGRMSDGFINGECDVLTPVAVYDTKCSDNPFTFPLWASTIDKGYHAQLQGYGHLYKRKSLVLAYCLVSKPMDMIERSAFFKTKAKYGPEYTEDEYQDILAEEIRNNTYDDLPIQLRVKLYKFDADPKFIEQVHDRVKMCRKYIATLEEQLIAEGKQPMYFEQPNQLTALQGDKLQVA